MHIEGTKSTSSIVNCHFLDNYADLAGAIYISNHIIEIQNCEFESNQATLGHGGSLYLACPQHD